LAKDHLRVDKTTGFDVFVRVLQSLMERGSIVLIEPVPGIERQEFDLGSFRQISPGR